MNTGRILLQELRSVKVRGGSQLPALCLLLDMQAPRLAELTVCCEDTAPDLSHVPKRVGELTLWDVRPTGKMLCFEAEGLGELVCTGRLQVSASKPW